MPALRLNVKAAGAADMEEAAYMLTIEQVKTRLRRQRVLYGRLVTSPDGAEWIRVGLTRAQLEYYLDRVTCYGFIQD